MTPQEPQNDTQGFRTLKDVTLHAVSVDTQPGPHGGTVTVASRTPTRFYVAAVDLNPTQPVTVTLIATGPVDMDALSAMLTSGQLVTLQPGT